VSGAVPIAMTSSVAVPPLLVCTFAGCSTIAGGVHVSVFVTVTVAALLLAAPQELVTSAQYAVVRAGLTVTLLLFVPTDLERSPVFPSYQ
jgi:hypothetical protein